MDRSKAVQELNRVAEDAKHTAAGLNKFLKPVPESNVEVEALIAKCFEISSALHGVSKALKDTRRSPTYKGIAPDIHDVVFSLDHTFEDVHRIVGEGFADAKKSKISQSSVFRKVWNNITEYFQRQSGNTLFRRLEYCRRLLLELKEFLYKGPPRDRLMLENLSNRVSDLLEVQEARSEKVIEWPAGSDTSSSPGPSKKKPSFERNRPDKPHAPTPSKLKKASRPRATGRHPPMESGWAPPRYPAAPDVPVSDTSTEYSNDSFPSSASHMATMSHWVQRVFERSPPATKLLETGQPSVCMDQDNPRALEWLADEYTRILQLAFENGDLMVSFFLRGRDGRARLLCEKIRPDGQQKDCTIYLTSLDVERDGPFLKFSHVNAKQRTQGLWCCLRFKSYEQLVLFFCTFLALRSQDNGQPIRHIDDWRLGREEVEFECIIVDDQFKHRLMLLRDKDSGGVRIQASARGEMKNMPIWTAFITHQIHSPRWMKQVRGSRIVLLNDLHRYIFDTEYSPPITSGGEHDLTFANEKDANGFCDAIEDLADDAENE